MEVVIRYVPCYNLTLFITKFYKGGMIYFHSKVFMVQATRLYSLICNLVDTCGLFRCTWECVCLCVYDAFFCLLGATSWSSPFSCVCGKVLVLVNALLLLLLLAPDVIWLPSLERERWWGGVKVRQGRWPSGHGRLDLSGAHWISYCTCLLEYLHIRQIF